MLSWIAILSRGNNRTYGEFYYAMQWRGKICILFNIDDSNPGRGKGGSPYERGGDARRLT